GRRERLRGEVARRDRPGRRRAHREGRERGAAARISNPVVIRAGRRGVAKIAEESEYILVPRSPGQRKRAWSRRAAATEDWIALVKEANAGRGREDIGLFHAAVAARRIEHRLGRYRYRHRPPIAPRPA